MKMMKLSSLGTLRNGMNYDKSSAVCGCKIIGVADFGNRVFPDYDSLSEIDSSIVTKDDLLQNGDIVFVRSNGNKNLVGRTMFIHDIKDPVCYPAVKDLSGAKEQVIMAMYIVTNEGKGEWFAVDDIIHLLVNVFEVPADSDKVNGVFKRNKSMFASEQDANNKKALRRKLLSGAKDFAVDIIQKNSAK